MSIGRPTTGHPVWPSTNSPINDGGAASPPEPSTEKRLVDVALSSSPTLPTTAKHGRQELLSAVKASRSPVGPLSALEGGEHRVTSGWLNHHEHVQWSPQGSSSTLASPALGPLQREMTNAYNDEVQQVLLTGGGGASSTPLAASAPTAHPTPAERPTPSEAPPSRRFHLDTTPLALTHQFDDDRLCHLPNRFRDEADVEHADHAADVEHETQWNGIAVSHQHTEPFCSSSSPMPPFFVPRSGASTPSFPADVDRDAYRPSIVLPPVVGINENDDAPSTPCMAMCRSPIASPTHSKSTFFPSMEQQTPPPPTPSKPSRSLSRLASPQPPMTPGRAASMPLLRHATPGGISSPQGGGGPVANINPFSQIRGQQGHNALQELHITPVTTKATSRHKGAYDDEEFDDAARVSPLMDENAMTAAARTRSPGGVLLGHTRFAVRSQASRSSTTISSAMPLTQHTPTSQNTMQLFPTFEGSMERTPPTEQRPTYHHSRMTSADLGSFAQRAGDDEENVALHTSADEYYSPDRPLAATMAAHCSAVGYTLPRRPSGVPPQPGLPPLHPSGCSPPIAPSVSEHVVARGVSQRLFFSHDDHDDGGTDDNHHRGGSLPQQLFDGVENMSMQPPSSAPSDVPYMSPTVPLPPSTFSACSQLSPVPEDPPFPQRSYSSSDTGTTVGGGTSATGGALEFGDHSSARLEFDGGSTSGEGGRSYHSIPPPRSTTTCSDELEEDDEVLRFLFTHDDPLRDDGTKWLVPLHIDVNGVVWLATRTIDGLPYAVKEVSLSSPAAAYLDVELECLTIAATGGGASTTRGMRAADHIVRYHTSYEFPSRASHMLHHGPQQPPHTAVVQMEYFPRGNVGEVFRSHWPSAISVLQSTLQKRWLLEQVATHRDAASMHTTPSVSPRHAHAHTSLPPAPPTWTPKYEHEVRHVLHWLVHEVLPEPLELLTMLQHALLALHCVHQGGIVHGCPTLWNLYIVTNYHYKLGSFATARRVADAARAASGNPSFANAWIESLFGYCPAHLLPPPERLLWMTPYQVDVFVVATSVLELIATTSRNVQMCVDTIFSCEAGVPTADLLMTAFSPFASTEAAVGPLDTSILTAAARRHTHPYYYGGGDHDGHQRRSDDHQTSQRLVLVLEHMLRGTSLHDLLGPSLLDCPSPFAFHMQNAYDRELMALQTRIQALEERKASLQRKEKRDAARERRSISPTLSRGNSCYDAEDGVHNSSGVEHTEVARRDDSFTSDDVAGLPPRGGQRVDPALAYQSPRPSFDGWSQKQRMPSLQNSPILRSSSSLSHSAAGAPMSSLQLPGAAPTQQARPSSSLRLLRDPMQSSPFSSPSSTPRSLSMNHHNGAAVASPPTSFGYRGHPFVASSAVPHISPGRTKPGSFSATSHAVGTAAHSSACGVPTVSPRGVPPGSLARPSAESTATASTFLRTEPRGGGSVFPSLRFPHLSFSGGVHCSSLHAPPKAHSCSTGDDQTNEAISIPSATCIGRTRDAAVLTLSHPAGSPFAEHAPKIVSSPTVDAVLSRRNAVYTARTVFPGVTQCDARRTSMNLQGQSGNVWEVTAPCTMSVILHSR